MPRLPTIGEIKGLAQDQKCINCGKPLTVVVVPLYQNPLGIGEDIRRRFGVEVLRELDGEGAGICARCSMS